MSFPLARIVSSLALVAPAALGQTTERVSVSTSGQEANGQSGAPKISADGRYVCFASSATNLVAGDTNGVTDVFVRDRLVGTTTRVSVDSFGNQGNGECGAQALSSDGRFIAFYSAATNLVTNDNNGSIDVFVHDLLTGSTQVVSLTTSGSLFPSNQAPNAGSVSISATGRYVTFCVPLGGFSTVLFRRDTQLATTAQVGVGGDRTSVSADGNFVAMQAAGVLNGLTILLLDAQQSQTPLQIAFPNPQYEVARYPVISTDGRFTVYESTGSLVPGDTNGASDIFLYDRTFSSTTRVSIQTGGGQSNGASEEPSLSDSGRFIVFSSQATNLDPQDTNTIGDVYLHDHATQATRLVSIGVGGAPANGWSLRTDVSDDGRFVAFDSNATNLVGGDTNSVQDIFVRDLGFAPPSAYCTAKVNSQGCTPAIGWTGTPSVSGADDFHVTASQVRNASPGIMFWGTSPTAVPFAGGTRCVQAPIIRTDFLISGGSPFPTADCTGTYDYPFTHAYMASFFLGAGTTVYAQFWQRDSIHPDGTGQGLTDGLRFTITP